MGRLKETLLTPNELTPLFQFHYGTIKSSEI